MVKQLTWQLDAKAFEEVGLFRPYLTTGGDADMCWRILRQTSWQLYFAEQAIVQHRHRATLKELQSQWQRYGRSNRYLHELHGVDLRRKLTGQESLYLISRWLLKEVPITTVKVIKDQAPLLDLLNTPINLFCTWSRSVGQQEAQLPEQAKAIEWLQEASRLKSRITADGVTSCKNRLLARNPILGFGTTDEHR
jgi:hypothetical protein